ncbi:hypothetical protein FA15DRAFT_647056 [Coprinopsis marcescibilis]|uniref:Cupredoxin n=1 Tax=Coprinopsis marcescibilis TaxID=230819 RepID=A0A5C3KKI1_COPMA|nr:hypothetical protein FA15DRAFT_647056 [Coprinopsis marcescibilis]
MRFSTAIVSAFLAAASLVSAETFTVVVGKDNALVYDPPTVTAKQGDIVEFQFLNKNHTVTQSTFASPCVPKADGVDSGFQSVPAGAQTIPSWSITINNDTAPLWFFCNQGPHCRNGMVFAVNPSAERTFDAFKANAATGGGATAGPNAAPPASPSGSAAAPGGTVAPAANAGAAPGGDNTAAQQAARNSGAFSTKSASVFGLVGAALVGGLLL